MALEALPLTGDHGPALKRVPRTIALLDVDPDLGCGLTPERFAAARHALRAELAMLPRGEWAGADAVAHRHVGLLVLDGVLAREILLEDTVSTELLGPGDFVRPWAGGDESLLRQGVRWQVLADARIALLGEAFGQVLPRFPEVNTVLLERACLRAQRLATSQAISHLNSVERRLLALFWHLAERWGRVNGEGIIVPLTISHRLLGELVGARRPTVSTALAALERQGRLRRREDATWLLLGEPAGMPAEHVRRVVSHRRRLLPSRP